MSSLPRRLEIRGLKARKQARIAVRASTGKLVGWRWPRIADLRQAKANRSAAT